MIMCQCRNILVGQTQGKNNCLIGTPRRQQISGEKFLYCLIAYTFRMSYVQFLYKERKAKAKEMQVGGLWWAISELLEDALLRRVVIWRVRAFLT
jgi:hypothetical protein